MPQDGKQNGFATVYVLIAITVITMLGLGVLQQISSQQKLARASEKKVDKNELIFLIDTSVDWESTWDEVCNHSGVRLTFKGRGPRFSDIRNVTQGDPALDDTGRENDGTTLNKGKGGSYKVWTVVRGECGNGKSVIVHYARIINRQFTTHPVTGKTTYWRKLGTWQTE